MGNKTDVSMRVVTDLASPRKEWGAREGGKKYRRVERAESRQTRKGRKEREGENATRHYVQLSRKEAQAVEEGQGKRSRKGGMKPRSQTDRQVEIKSYSHRQLRRTNGQTLRATPRQKRNTNPEGGTQS